MRGTRPAVNQKLRLPRLLFFFHRDPTKDRIFFTFKKFNGAAAAARIARGREQPDESEREATGVARAHALFI